MNYTIENRPIHSYLDKWGNVIVYDVTYYCNKSKTISRKECNCCKNNNNGKRK